MSSVVVPSHGRQFQVVVLAVAVLVLAGDVWLVRRAGGSAIGQLTFALRILGLYGIVVGFLKSSGKLARFGGLLDEMTSPNFFRFVAGNAFAFGIAFEGMGLGLRGPRDTRLASLGQLLLVPAALVLVAFAAFHFLVVMPLAYLAYLAAGAVVQAIASAPGDVQLTELGPGPQAISIRAALSEDPVAARSYLVGVPSLVLSFAVELVSKLTA